MEKIMNSISMNGRMAYVIMCLEALRVDRYPESNWRFVAKRLWQATSMNWADWLDMYSAIIPDVLLQYPT